MLDDDEELPDLRLDDVLNIMNDSFSQIQKELNELRTLVLEGNCLIEEFIKNKV